MIERPERPELDWDVGENIKYPSTQSSVKRIKKLKRDAVFKPEEVEY